MARLTKADAARQLGIARSTLYKLIDQGAISATPDGMIDSAELIRGAASVDRLRERSQTSAYMRPRDAKQHGETPQRHIEDSDRERSQTLDREQTQTSEDTRSRTYVDLLVDTLREQLQDARERIQREHDAAQERERAYREHIERLTLMLHEAQHRSDRLLEAPRTVPASPAPLPASESPAPRGEMRRRIMALLQAHPDGLSPGQTRQRLGVDKALGSTMKAMARDGLLRRVETGWYVAREE